MVHFSAVENGILRIFDHLVWLVRVTVGRPEECALQKLSRAERIKVGGTGAGAVRGISG